ncbi:MAG: FkbM family methyltransferase [Verrucomicrobiaceae bacterium]|nr:FkbM family methyltransferase [Verrucomicrobiaceae bacterium]
MNLCGHATRPLNHRGFYQLTKKIGKLCSSDSTVQVRLNEDSLYEFLVCDPYWNRLIHEYFYYEPEIFYFLDLLKGSKFAFVDGGANWGFWSVLASSSAYGAVETVAYEPMPNTFAFLARNAAINSDRFRIVQKALAVKDIKDVPMDVGDAAERSAAGASIAQSRDRGAGSGILVDAIGLDRALSELHSAMPTVIKLDLEGVERAVIDASHWVDDHDCVLIFEDHAKDPACEVSAAVMARDWPVYFFHDDGRLDLIKSVEQLAGLKTSSHRGYNLFGAHPGGVFDQLFMKQLND